MLSARALALDALARWRGGTEFADKIIGELLATTSLGASDRAFAHELFYGVLRNLTLLDFSIGQLRSEPVEDKTRDLLRLGLYQILLIETAAHAAVFETVALARPRVRALINAILRRALREKDALVEAVAKQPLAVRFSIPGFLAEKWMGQFEEDGLERLCLWNNQPPPVYARINRLKITVEEFLARYPESALLPEQSNFIRLPGLGLALAAGECYIQDPSTALACELLQAAPGESVLDACAAPGGKAAYLAEMMQNKGVLVAAEQDEVRRQRMRENFSLLGVKADIVRCDWTDPESIRAAGFQNRSFDRILLDAPCTNTGVMRRRVDVRWRLRADDFARMSRKQLAILRAVGPLLRPGGSLVYSTCSLEPEENERVVEAFLREEAHFHLSASKRSLPFRDGYDGAYAARLELSAS